MHEETQETRVVGRNGADAATTSRSDSSTHGPQRSGGFAALVAAATYVVGFALLFTVLAPTTAEPVDPDRLVAFLADNQTIMYLWNVVIYVVNGVALVVLVLALHERLRTGPPAPVRIATVFGLIWAGLVIASGMLIINDLGVVVDLFGTDPAQAAAVWTTLHAVEEGLGGGVELPGGIWVLLISWAGLRARALPRPAGYLGLAAGVAGVLTVLPAADAFEAVFGLGLLVWFAWVGVVLLRSGLHTTAYGR